MTPEQGLYGLAVALVTAIGAWLVAKVKANADSKAAAAATKADLSGTTWVQAQEWIDRMDRKIEALEADNKEIREENKLIRRENQEIRIKHEELWSDNRRLREENTDQQKLIEEVAEYLLETDDWHARGAKPPAPGRPLRIAQHVELIRRKYKR